MESFHKVVPALGSCFKSLAAEERCSSPGPDEAPQGIRFILGYQARERLGDRQVGLGT